MSSPASRPAHLLPLLEQLRQRYGEAVSIEYRQREPGAIVIDFIRTPAR